jgi:hypothetical protein
MRIASNEVFRQDTDWPCEHRSDGDDSLVVRIARCGFSLLSRRLTDLLSFQLPAGAARSLDDMMIVGLLILGSLKVIPCSIEVIAKVARSATLFAA